MNLEEQIRARAHQIWESEGRPEGLQDEHWERARRELEGAGSVAGETPKSQPGGLSSGLQPGGTIPGGSPASTTGSFGTGGGSTNRKATGGAAKQKI